MKRPKELFNWRIEIEKHRRVFDFRDQQLHRFVANKRILAAIRESFEDGISRAFGAKPRV